jgi:hypothetical protein
VRILEPGDHHAALEIDDACVGADVLLEIEIGADEDDVAAADRDRIRPAARPSTV